MTLMSIDINAEKLRMAKELSGAGSDSETVDIALSVLIAQCSRPEANTESASP